MRRDGDRWNALKSSLEGSPYCSRVEDVIPEIVTTIHPRQHKGRRFIEHIHRRDDAIRRRAFYGESIRSKLLASEGAVKGNAVARSASFAVGSYHYHVAKFRYRARQSRESR